MLDFLKSFFSKTNLFPGLIVPEKTDLIQSNEIVAEATPVTWKDLDLNKISSYPIMDQDGSSACVAFSLCLLATIMYYLRTGITIPFSPGWIYNQRSNKPSGGMIGTESFAIGAKGMLPGVIMPSEKMGENAINNIPTNPWYSKVAEVFSFDDHPIQLLTGDIDGVASTMMVTGKPVMVWFGFGDGEWNSEPVMLSQVTKRHSVVAIDYGMWKGKKAIVIQDSWGMDSTTYKGRRIITSDFYANRNIFAAYVMRFKFDVASISKPKYDGTIISLQKCLRFEGFFPSNVSFVESYGKITTQAVWDFQKKYGISLSGTLTKETIAKLKNLFP